MDSVFLRGVTLSGLLHAGAERVAVIVAELPLSEPFDVYQYETDGYDRRRLYENAGGLMPSDVSRDGRWVLLGSAHWDARSLQLNFEMNVSTMNPELAEELGRLLDRKISSARRLTAADVEARSLPVKLRGGALRLFSPYL